MKRTNLKKTVISVFCCLLVGIFSGIIANNSFDNWFLTIKKPVFSPPFWLFGFIWLIIHVLIGYSFSILWSRKAQSRRSKSVLRIAMTLFGIQLGLNLIWAYIFFGLCNPFLALIEILLLWLLTFETIKSFKKIDHLASKLLLPYMIWISFTVILNGSIWFMNS